MFKRWLYALQVALLMSAPAAHADIALAGITEAKGGGAVAGVAFRRGYQLAIEEINASGGVLGEQLTVTNFDIETSPDAALAAAKSAVAGQPFAILGPVFSGLTLSAMSATHSSGIPHFTGGEAVSIARKFHPTILRTSLSQMGAVPRLAAVIAYGLGAKKVAVITVDNDFGRDARVLLREGLTRRGSTPLFDGTVQPGQTDVDAVVGRALESGPEAVALYLNEAESIAVLKALRKQRYDGHIIGEAPLVSAPVLDAVGPTADGVVAHTGISVDLLSPRMRAFVSAFQKRFNTRPDHNAVKGYFAVQLIKTGLTRIGKVDRAAFVSLIKNSRFDGRVNQDLMTTVSYDFFGDLNRESYLVQVKGGSTEILGTLNAFDSQRMEMADGKSYAFSSNELRRELVTALSRPRRPLPAK